MTHPRSDHFGLENHMVIGPYYDETRPVDASEPDTCAICGEEEFDMRDTHMGLLCSSCTRPCAHCEDWMMDDSGLMHDGKLMHIACALEAMEAAQDVLTVTPMQVVRIGEMDGAA